jgi:hypothetical protein
MLRSAMCASAALLLLSMPAAAQTIVINSGGGFLYWDSSLTSVTIASDDSQFVTETHTGSDGGVAGGATLDLSTVIPMSNAGNHPLPQTYHGQQYQAWVSGSLQITAKPIVVPHAPPNADGTTSQTFTTTFTMTGTITAYATSALTGSPLFTTSVTGGGTITAGPYTIVGDTYLQRSGDSVAFSGPSSPLCSSWTSADVGAVVIQGFASSCGEPRDVFGSGADIWGTADAFQFLYQPIAADGELAAQLVAPVQNTLSGPTSPYAKAGLMIRQTLDPSSPQVILDVRPGGEIEFMTRAAAAGPTTFIAGGSTTFPVWLRLARHAGNVVGYTSLDGVTWATIGSAPAPAGDAFAGFAVTSHDTSARDRGSFSHIGLWRLPPGWSQQDVGAVGRTGSATASDAGEFTVAGAGADIWATSDAFDAVTQPLQGDATLVARVVSVENTNMFAKAGLTVGTLSPGATRVILDTRPDGNIEFMTRLADGAAMSFIGGAATTVPVWLRLVRTGDQFTGSISPDGAAWTTVGSATVNMPASVPGGLAVTSHDVTRLNTSTFDHVAVSGSTSPPPSGQNLLINPGFESYVPPALGAPGWISDTFRQTPARSETTEPHSGAINGACRTTTAVDCGIYQDVVAPADGTYTFAVYANASRAGAWVGANVNGSGVQSAPIAVRTSGYGTAYSMSFAAHAGDTIRVWLYSPASPGSAVIDDASLTY